MSLSAGTRLGPYEVIGPLGAGGMGEVYRARDTRLGRDVAIKVIRPRLTTDSEQLRRFEQEARAASQLNHPNILVVHDLGSHEGSPYIVSELLEGESLRDKLGAPLPTKKAVEYALQIAHGLAAAHEKGIVHRDLKPENLFVTKDGRIKILDFGVAKLTQPVLPSVSMTEAPTVAPSTDAGVVLGTVGYMSPEQVLGKHLDARSDLFSLGVVLYEMLSGKRPFQKETAPETMAAILREEPPDLSATNQTVPPGLDPIVRHCLEKEPSNRFQSARDVAFALESLSQGTTGGATPIVAGLRPRSWRSLPGSVAVSLVAAAVLAGALVTVVLLKGTARTPAPVTRLEIRIPAGHYLSQWRQPFALSPDGRLLVFSAFTWKKPFEEKNPPQLFLRPLDNFEARPIPGTEGGHQPVFSPDGRHVAFIVFSDHKWFLKRLPVAGGIPATICQCDARFGVAWSPDGSILFGSAKGPLQRVADSGGTPEAATSLDVTGNEVSHRLPHLLPDGRTVFYTAMRLDNWERHWKLARIFAQRLGDKERSLLAEDGSDGRWVEGHLLFAREGRLFAAPFDTKNLRLTGKPVPILEGVSHSIWTGNTWTETGAAMLDVSGSRVFAWIPGSVTPEYQNSLVWVDASGKETPVDIPKGPFLGGRVSPDGKRLLVQYVYPGRQVEVLELSRGGRRNVTFGMDPLWAIWGPGPDRITFNSYHEGPMRIYSRRIDAGSEEVETLLKTAGSRAAALGCWSRDGKTLAFSREGDKIDGDNIWLLEQGKEPHPLVASRFEEYHPDISPDGRWLLYDSDEPGRPEVFVRRLSGEDSPRQVSVGGGGAPLWSRDGSAIFYWSLSQGIDRGVLFRVHTSTAEDGLSFGRPERLLEVPFLWTVPGHTWDVAPDGRFLIVKPPDEADRRAWFEKVLSDRIYVDLGGLPALLSEAGRDR